MSITHLCPGVLWVGWTSSWKSSAGLVGIFSTELWLHNLNTQFKTSWETISTCAQTWPVCYIHIQRARNTSNQLQFRRILTKGFNVSLKSLRHKLCILSINHPNTLNYEYYKQYMWNFRSHSICRCTPCSLIHFNHKIPKVSRSLQEQHITGGDCCCGFLLWQKVNILYLGLLCLLRGFLYVFIEQHPSQKTIETWTL